MKPTRTVLINPLTKDPDDTLNWQWYMDHASDISFPLTGGTTVGGGASQIWADANRCISLTDYSGAYWNVSQYRRDGTTYHKTVYHNGAEMYNPLEDEDLLLH